MLTSGEVLCGEQLRSAEIQQRVETRDWVLGVALAILIAVSVLLMPAVAGAAAQDGKSEPTSASAAGNYKVSPYVIASRRRMEEQAASGERPMKRPLGQPMRMKPVSSSK